MPDKLVENPVAHFEIFADDPPALARFYAELFTWQVDAIPGLDYRLVRTVATDTKGFPTQPGGINGGILKRPHPDVRGWLSYVQVASVDTALTRAESLGATITRRKTPIPGRGWFGLLIDPQGNPFAVWEDDAQAA